MGDFDRGGFGYVLSSVVLGVLLKTSIFLCLVFWFFVVIGAIGVVVRRMRVMELVGLFGIFVLYLFFCDIRYMV